MGCTLTCLPVAAADAAHPITTWTVNEWRSSDVAGGPWLVFSHTLYSKPSGHSTVCTHAMSPLHR